MNKTKTLLKRAIILSTTLGVVAGIGSLINNNEVKARGRNSRSSVTVNGNTTKRPVTNAIPTRDEDTQYTKDFISPPISLYKNTSNRDKSKHKEKSSRFNAPKVVINISTNK